MMPQLIDKKKKLFIYFFVFFLLSTTSNKFINNLEFSLFSVGKIDVSGLSNDDNFKVTNDLNRILFQNIFFINKDNLIKILSKNNLIETFYIKKVYPNLLKIDLKKTTFIAITNNNNQNFFIGTNGKLIKYKDSDKVLPFVFGKVNYANFLEFKKIIDKSEINFKKIHSIYFFPSNRWDIKTSDGTLIKLPEKNLSQALKIAYKIMSAEQFKINNFIDLRVLNHIIILK